MDKDVVHTYDRIVLNQKKNEAMPLAGLGDHHTEPRELEKERQTLYDTTYVGSKKAIKTNLFLKQKQSHRLQKWTYGHRRGQWGRGIN